LPVHFSIGIFVFTSLSKSVMERRKYKKHMKHASDLFWVPSNGQGEVAHWQFDESYQSSQFQEFSSKNPEQSIRDIFTQRSSRVSDSVSTIDPVSIESVQNNPSTRSFLSFPDGFCRDIRRTERSPIHLSPMGWF
jgi:hypothetical protein